MSKEANVSGGSCCGCLVIVVIAFVVIGFVGSLFSGSEDDDEILMEDNSSSENEVIEEAPEEQIEDEEPQEEGMRVAIQMDTSPISSIGICTKDSGTGECTEFSAGQVIEVEKWSQGNYVSGSYAKVKWEESNGETRSGEIGQYALGVPAKEGDSVVLNSITTPWSAEGGNGRAETSDGSSVDDLDPGTPIRVLQWEVGDRGRTLVEWRQGEEVVRGLVSREYLSPAAPEGNEPPFAVKEVQ